MSLNITLPFLILIILSLFTPVRPDCAFLVNETYWPYIPDETQKDGFEILEAECQQWLGQQGCCNHQAYTQMVDNFKQLDAVFGSSEGGSGGCDLCAINLKRFWCSYACHPNQANFAKVGDWIWVPSYDKPNTTVYVQQISLTVQSQTACKIFQSCKRTSYASQLSALQNPAGFLNFQGTNAIDAHQIITVDFTEDRNHGLYLDDIDNCSVKLPQNHTYRGFPVKANCSCNSCDSECQGGNFYKPTSVMYGFNYELVFWVWGGVVAGIVALTMWRYWRGKSKRE